MGKNARAEFVMGLRRAPTASRVVDPVQRAMDRAPIDDEPLTEEEARSLDEAEKGPFYSLEEVRAVLAARRRA